MRELRNVVEEHRHRAFIGDARVVRPERIVRHRRAVVVRRDDEHRVGAALRRILRATHALARRLGARAREEPAISGNERTRELGEAKALVLIEQRGLAGGASDEHAREASGDVRLDVRAEGTAREITARVVERRDDGAENPRQRFRHGGGQGLFRSRRSPAVESVEPPSREIERAVSSNTDSAASSLATGVKKLRKTVLPQRTHGSSAGGVVVKNISLPQVMQISVSIPPSLSFFAIESTPKRVCDMTCKTSAAVQCACC